MVSETGGEAPAAGAAGRRRRKTIGLALKLALGLGIIGVIVAKISFLDEIRFEDAGEPVRGRGLRIEGALVAKDEAGNPLRFPLEGADPPVLVRKDGRIEVRRHGAPPVAVTEHRFEGAAEIEVDGAVVRRPLAEVAVKEGVTDESGTELLLEAREGLLTIYGRLSLGRYLLAMALLLLMYVTGIWRWRVLLQAQGLVAGVFEATRLTFIGFFFNNVVPGLTGGDVIKAVMIARAHRGNGAAAVSTVIVDRVVGLLVLAVIGAAALLFTLDRYRTIAFWLFAFLGGSGAAIALFLSRRVRRKLRFDVLLKRLPGAAVLQSLDRAFLLYRERKGAIVAAVVLSVVGHLANIVSIYLMGTDLGLDQRAGLEGDPFVSYLVTVPIILIASSIPLLPGGWGVGELAFGFFFRTVGITNLGLSIGLSVLSRASQLLWSLLGGVFLVLERADAREAIKEGLDDGVAVAAP